MLIRREPGELYALRHQMPSRPQGPPVEAWVDQLDPLTLQTIASSRRLPGGPYWPGGLAAHACGDLHVVFGQWAHRLSSSLELLASHRLPVDRPHNSFIVLDGGELVMKDCDAPAGLKRSLLSALDPITLLPVAEPLLLPEPSIARLSSDGRRIIAVGTSEVFRITLDRDAGRFVLEDDWRPKYGPAPDRSYGWDPVLSDDHVFWMDNGRNATDLTMLDSAASAGPVRLWWARHDDDQTRSVEISGLPYGTESNPPGWDPVGRVVVAYDAGNAVLRAWRMDGDELSPLWRRDNFAHAGHLILYPETRELVVQDWQGRTPPAWGRRMFRSQLGAVARLSAARSASLKAFGGDRLVVLDLDSGEEKGSCAVPSPFQAYLFPAPGFGRDIYYQSMTTVGRVQVTGG
ncbi:MAG: hypothetical protein JHD02_00965 [Thermoleophilaceae bacterium]|nr:hypothetical protein [Thermoleophilaceae bacterium]